MIEKKTNTKYSRKTVPRSYKTRKTVHRSDKTRKTVPKSDKVVDTPLKDPFPVFSQFEMNDEFITNFSRYIESPKDCLISALQLLGVINSLTANIMRISSTATQSGQTKEEIEKIFIVVKGNNFEFKKSNNYNEFIATIKSHLIRGHACFAGYEGSTSHVFLIAKDLQENILYLEPQIKQNGNNGTICDIVNDPVCEGYLKGKNNYFRLYNSREKLTNEELKSLGLSV
jgi:hypothetical protein